MKITKKRLRALIRETAGKMSFSMHDPIQTIGTPPPGLENMYNRQGSSQDSGPMSVLNSIVDDLRNGHYISSKDASYELIRLLKSSGVDPVKFLAKALIDAKMS